MAIINENDSDDNSSYESDDESEYSDNGKGSIEAVN
jgi:hypothetical protein